ncbi:DUF1702 family protein [Streptosporangium carneum]|uniref:Enediyne biosynthesis protein n=1 Tax=Streptosporangium carneum TaxID=47481 RepID=A0A9W6I6W4_9ACTN|nr:DUF1702 family protein [Streptosporangium carneum]GLK12278.1 enediyne biosynthesis protein [Streptosporangium carneum]
MANSWRALRRRVLTPSVSATKLETRGFNEKSPAARELLETIGKTFLAGYAYAAEARSPAEAEERLETIPTRFRGFAYEGAAMAFTVLDALPLTGGRRVAGFLSGRGDDHVYMAYVGIGWAMARLPRFRWPDVSALDPLLRWLVLDGYGFHQAYFHTNRYVHAQFSDPRFPWTADRFQSYANRAIDQGIGRAMWFVGGTDAALVADMIDRFPESRRDDLYAGAGLAASYAGGAEEQELRAFWERAGRHRPQIAQGCAFAAEARQRAGLVVPHTLLATRVFCDMTPEQAARTSEKARPDEPVQGDLPAYEVWRQRVADEFASLGRC